MAPSDLSVSVPAELRADAVVVLSGADGARLAVVVEVQLRYDQDKRYSWPAYLTQIRAAQRCPAVLLVICPRTGTAARCRAPIRTGHPGFDLEPLVVDAATIPDSGGPGLREHPELVVLAVLTGALDLDQDSSRRLVLTRLAGLDEGRLKTYTVFVLNAASQAARQALEALMSTAPFKNDFVDRLLAEGKAEGKAEGEAKGKAEGKAEEARKMLLLQGRDRFGEPSAKIAALLNALTDVGQLEALGLRLLHVKTWEELFGVHGTTRQPRRRKKA